MRLVLLCFLVLFLGTCVRAQTDEDFAPFRPDVQYLYANTDPALALPDGPLHSPLVGFTYSDGTWQPDNGNYVLRATAQTDVYRKIPHFTGARYAVPEPGELMMYGYDGHVFRLRYGAAVGESWMATPTVYCTIDSIVSEDFLGTFDRIKFISALDTDGTAYPTIKISERYGLLQGIYFSEPALMSVAFPVVAIEKYRHFTLGQAIPTAESIADVETDGEYYEQAEWAETRNGQSGTRITQRSYRKYDWDRCDPLYGGYELGLRLRQVSYFQPADGSAPQDSIVSPTRNAFSVISWDRFSGWHNDWIAAPVGTVRFFEPFNSELAGSYRVVHFTEDDCYGTGIMASRPLLEIDENILQLAPPATYFSESTAAYFPSLAWPDKNWEGEHEVYARLVGANTQKFTCGTQFDFDHLYSPVATAFPDDPLITLAPNPATERTMISVPFEHGSAFLEVYDAAGRLQRITRPTGGDRWLALNGLKPGVYTVVIRNESGPLAQRRVVVQW